MESGYEIVWTDEAKQGLNNIIRYLETHWTEKELKKFFKRLEKAIKLVSERPELFSASGTKSGVRIFVFIKQVSLYYKEENDKVFIVSLFDNRMDPSKLAI